MNEEQNKKESGDFVLDLADRLLHEWETKPESNLDRLYGDEEKTKISQNNKMRRTWYGNILQATLLAEEEGRLVGAEGEAIKNEAEDLMREVNRVTTGTAFVDRNALTEEEKPQGDQMAAIPKEMVPRGEELLKRLIAFLQNHPLQ